MEQNLKHLDDFTKKALSKELELEFPEFEDVSVSKILEGGYRVRFICTIKINHNGNSLYFQGGSFKSPHRSFKCAVSDIRRKNLWLNLILEDRKKKLPYKESLRKFLINQFLNARIPNYAVEKGTFLDYQNASRIIYRSKSVDSAFVMLNDILKSNHQNWNLSIDI